MLYLSAVVQQPTTPASPQNTAVGLIQVAHRRRSTSGSYSGTQVLTGTVIPNTFTYQRSANTEYVAAEEILIRDGGIGLWRKIPASIVGTTGSFVFGEANIPATWETVTDAELADNQDQFAISSLNFGEFGSASEPSQTVFLYNDGDQTINSLALTVLAGDEAELAVLSGRIRVDYQGVFGQTGVGLPDTQFDGALVYSSADNNSYRIIVPPRSAVRLTISLINFPATGLASTALSAQFLFVPNRTGFTVPAFQDWAEGGLQLDPDRPFVLATESTEAPLITVAPYRLRVGNAIFGTSNDRNILPNTSLTGSVDLILFVSTTGLPGAVDDATPLPTGALEVARLTWDSATGAISNYRVTTNIQEPRQYREPNTLLTEGRAVILDNLGLLEHGQSAIGVAVGSQGYYVTHGHALIETSATVAIGDRLSPDADGIWTANSSGTAVALEAGTGLIQGYLTGPAPSGGGGGGGGPTNLGVTEDATTVTITNDNGTNAILESATSAVAGIMTAADKDRLDNIVDRPYQTIETSTGDATTRTLRLSGNLDTVVLTAATTSIAGLMTASDKTKLDGLGSGGPGSADLGIDRNAISATVTNTGGTDATIPQATGSLAGVLSAADKAKLDTLSAVNLTTNQQPTETIINNSGGGNATIVSATTTSSGVMSSADKQKLDGVASGATQSNLSISRVGDVAVVANSGGTGFNITAATTSVSGLLIGSDKAKLDNYPTTPRDTNLGNSRSAIDVTITSSTGTATTIPRAVASTSAGVMAAADKTKLDALTIETFTTLTPLNGWTNFGGVFAPLTAAKHGNIVVLNGMVSSGSVGSVICNLPVGFRPTTGNSLFLCACQNSGSVGYIRLDVQTDGDVLATVSFVGSPSTWTVLNNISFVG